MGEVGVDGWCRWSRDLLRHNYGLIRNDFGPLSDMIGSKIVNNHCLGEEF